MAGVDGRVQTRNYEGNDGKRVYVTEIVAESVQFLEPRNSNGGGGNNYQSGNNNNNYNSGGNNFGQAPTNNGGFGQDQQQSQNQNYQSTNNDPLQVMVSQSTFLMTICHSKFILAV